MPALRARYVVRITVKNVSKKESGGHSIEMDPLCYGEDLTSVGVKSF